MRHLLGSAVGFGVCLAALCHASSADRTLETHAPATLVHTFRAGTAGDFVAIALKATGDPVAVQRHILMVDTSASQTGVFRDLSLELAEQLVKLLPQNQLLEVFAVDTQATSLTGGFVKAGSNEAFAAIQMLKDRTPLGATHLGRVLNAVLAAAADGVQTSVLYIGDGQSSAGLMQLSEVESLTNSMQTNNVAFHAALLGPKVDRELSGLMVNQSGGTLSVVADSASGNLRKIAMSMQQAPVMVRDLQAVDSDLKVAAAKEVALRHDRHTIVLAQGSAKQEYQLSAMSRAGEQLSWTAGTKNIVSSGPEVKVLYQRASESQGLNTPVVGVEGLRQAAAELKSSVESSVRVASQLQRAGRSRDALNVARQGAALDSGNVQLTSLMNTIQQDGPLDQLGPATNADQEPLGAAEARIARLTKRLELEVNAAIDEARRVSSELPEYSVALLKDILNTVRDSADINPEIRAELDRRVVSAIAVVQSQTDRNRLEQSQLAQRQATFEAQKKLLTQTNLEEERLQTLIDQVRGLLDHARHGDDNAYEAAEEVSRTALQLQPGNGTATAALVVSEAAGQLDKAYKLVNLRHDRFLETLYQVELSHVPFPDEPPVIYPPADVWRALTLSRKPKYESVDLRSEQPAEAWLRRMLKEPAPPLDYPGEVSLEEVLQQIADHYTNTYGSEGGGVGSDFRMTIFPDRGELDLESVNLADVTVQDIQLKGITLKNALQLIFSQTKDPDLTYMIRNEVLLITTVDAAESDENLITRVYPLGDLAIPPSLHLQLGGGQGGQGGQGGGGFGGGQGGGGFGGGGQGGGGFGGGGQGGGGGLFNIAPEVLTPAAAGGISNDAVKQLKKKPGLAK